MARFDKIRARWVLDSRGNPTVEAVVSTSDGVFRAMVPSGASTGKHEALELRDGGKSFHGKHVLKAVANVHKAIAPELQGREFAGQKELDAALLALDGSSNKSKLGANAILSVSLAGARALAASEQKPLHAFIAGLCGNPKPLLPVPCANVINGGKHAGNQLDVQEYMLAPTGFGSFAAALQAVSEIYHQLKKDLVEKFGKNAVNVGDEGGFAPPMSSVEMPLERLSDAIKECGYEKEMQLALDPAATEFYKDGKYLLEGSPHAPEMLIEKYAELVDAYPLVSLEDGLAEDDWPNWVDLTGTVGNKIQIVGDDLLVTNRARIERAVREKACNALLLKVNQIGSLTEALEAAVFARESGWNVMVSHRSGETEDAFIADLAVGLGCGQLKSGAPARGERTAKYNQLLRLEEELGGKARFAGKNAFAVR